MSEKKDDMEEGYTEELTEEELNDTLNALKGKFVIIEDLDSNILEGTLIEFDGNAVKVKLDPNEEKSEVDIPLSEIASLSWVYEENGEEKTYTLEF